MAKILQFAVLFVVLSVAYSFQIIASQSSYTDPSEKITLNCDNYEWKTGVVIEFYKDTELIFSSVKDVKSPYVSGTERDRAIVLNSTKTKGWGKMSCRINGLKSDNTLTVPFMANFSFGHSPDDYRINHRYTVNCLGEMNPPGKVTYSFRFQNHEIANITDGVLSISDYPYIDVISNHFGHNYIVIIPNSDIVYGEYFCEMIFQADEKKKAFAVSNAWKVSPGPTVPPTTDSPNNLDKHFPLVVNRKYYSKDQSDVQLSCNGTSWTQWKRIIFYTDKMVIYDSNFKVDKFPMVSKVVDNKTVILSEKFTTGWDDLSCTIDDVRSKNMATIPFTSGVKLTHSPAEFQLNQVYNLTCEGFVLPKPTMSAKFYLEDKMFAEIIGGDLFPNANIPGLEFDRKSVTNNSFAFRPTRATNQGRYWCAIHFTIPFSDLTNITSANYWQAGRSPAGKNSSSATSGTAFVMLFASVFALIANLFY